MPYVELLLGGFPLQSLQLLLVCDKYSSTLVRSLLIYRLLLLSPVMGPNRHAPSVMPLFFPLILFKYVAFSLCPSDLYFHCSPSWLSNPWVQKYELLRQLPFLYLEESVFLVLWPNRLVFGVLMSPWSFWMSFFIISMAASLVTIWLACSAT